MKTNTPLWESAASLMKSCEAGNAQPVVDVLIELESLRNLRDEVVKWAKTPGNHGGNPYMHKFVKMAMELAGE